ncbi:MAG: hypothetical protein A2539_02425 [Elusimicrobia bacterium RIFOXYD2_FULL_34_15]|nr:MAG: hypothetical protein A2539_02425 [Elusimicrobia bacterium RIFOXYD2_FULL_34_15]
MRKQIVIIIIIFSAIIVGLGVSLAFGNTVNPNCPSEVRQAITNWDVGLDARDQKNLVIPSYGIVSPKKNKDVLSLRHLFLYSLITLLFNTPIHSQIYVTNSLKKLFTVAKHYLNLPVTRNFVPSLIAIFTTIKRFFEKVILLLLGLISPIICLLLVTRFSLPITNNFPLIYRFNNLRL